MGTGALPSNRINDIGSRIVVIGSTGSGKTTLAGQLSRKRGVPHVELDGLFWGPNWTPTPTDEFRARIVAALAGDRWVADGNYSKLQDTIWARADTIVWLDYSLTRVWARLARRTGYRLITRTELWSGNRERWKEVFQRDSLFLWAVHQRRHNRPRYLALFSDPEELGKTVVHLRSPRETRRWLESLPSM